MSQPVVQSVCVFQGVSGRETHEPASCTECPCVSGVSERDP